MSTIYIGDIAESAGFEMTKPDEYNIGFNQTDIDRLVEAATSDEITLTGPERSWVYLAAAGALLNRGVSKISFSIPSSDLSPVVFPPAHSVSPSQLPTQPLAFDEITSGAGISTSGPLVQDDVDKLTDYAQRYGGEGDWEITLTGNALPTVCIAVLGAFFESGVNKVHFLQSGTTVVVYQRPPHRRRAPPRRR